MKTLLMTSVIALVLGLSGAAYAQGYCPQGYYFASDGQCYPNQSYQPYYQQPSYVTPPIVLDFGFGGDRRGFEHRGFEHGGFEHGEHHEGGHHH